ncbi:NUDIX domain-containing protein [Micromonospora sp. RL09-050-HVF-A]|uniref:NUDIX hydrolase n=1 Tax=Micromonospora sp. RL09-050-HVF-A TaxID=1703433 RepID=UPI001C5E60C5|nr:NUDIX domain-containing protein [Micromonospora sp. RL09-050-HVF-A]MBW4703480.1 NUDIX domain-containing protein [Micromonospora sp. RL09-050-HVF-A]
MTIDSPGFPAPPALVEHARRFHAEGATPVTPRVAATVLLLRPAGTDFEVYVIRRVAAMAFGGVYAFPGGGVDPSDSEAHLDWTGPDPAAWAGRLGVTPDAAQAVVCAAAREVFEEAGVLLAGPGGGPVTGDVGGSVVGDVSGDDWETARQDLEARRRGFAGLLAERQLTLRSDLLLPWSRWITPEFEPRRFDTYFFVALLPEGQRTRDVSGEADHTMWVRPADALARARAGELTMLPPTLVTLAEVAAAAAADGAAGAGAGTGAAAGDGARCIAAVARASAARDAATPVTPRLHVPEDGTPHFTLA